MGLKAVATLVPGGGAPVGGTGTPGKLAKFTGTGTSIGDSVVTELAGKIGINVVPGTLLHVSDNIAGIAGTAYDGVRLSNTSEALFSSSDGIRSFRAGVTGSAVYVGSTTSHDLLLQRGNVTALTLGAAGAVTFAGNLTSSAAQTWTLAAGTSALNIQSGLLNLDTTNSRVGIGTASPTGRLHVVGGTAAAATNGAPVTIIAQSAGTGNQNGGNIVITPGALSGSGSAGVADLSGPTGTGLKLPATPGNADAQVLDCYAETDVSSGYTLSGVTATSGAITVAIRATRIGRTMTFAVSITPAGGASLTFAAAWYLTMTGVSAPAFSGSLAVSSNDATITRGTAWVNAAAGPTVYGSATVLGANVSLFLNGTI